MLDHAAEQGFCFGDLLGRAGLFSPVASSWVAIRVAVNVTVSKARLSFPTSHDPTVLRGVAEYRAVPLSRSFAVRRVREVTFREAL